MVFATSEVFPNTKLFSQKKFCGSFEISLFVSRDTYKDKVAYSWISPNPASAGIHWEFVVVWCRERERERERERVSERGRAPLPVSRASLW